MQIHRHHHCLNDDCNPNYLCRWTLVCDKLSQLLKWSVLSRIETFLCVSPTHCTDSSAAQLLHTFYHENPLLCNVGSGERYYLYNPLESYVVNNAKGSKYPSSLLCCLNWRINQFSWHLSQTSLMKSKIICNFHAKKEPFVISSKK